MLTFKVKGPSIKLKGRKGHFMDTPTQAILTTAPIRREGSVTIRDAAVHNNAYKCVDMIDLRCLVVIISSLCLCFFFKLEIKLRSILSILFQHTPLV